MAKTYDTYKDSGIAWIGNIPSGWDCCKLLYLLRKPISDGPHETPILQDSGIPFISVDSLNETEDINFDNVKKFISEDLYHEYSKKTILEENDILFSKAATIGKTAIVKKEIFMVWSPLAIIKCKESVFYYRFTYHLLSCQKLIEDVIMHGSYNTQINIGMRELEKVNVPFPSLSEQQAIATYLDEKCGEIDSLISLQEEMISELQAYKQSVITETVTKGLDPNVPMKDSSVEWIGQIPSNWGKDKIFRIFFIIGSGTTPKATDERIFDGNINWIQSGDINGGIMIECKNKISEIVLSQYSTLKIYKAPFIIVAMYGASVGNISISNIDGCVNQACCVMSDSRQCFSYLFYAIKAAKDYLIYRAEGGGQPNISQDKIKNLWLPLPPLSEQQAIASYLDEKTSQIDSLIALKQEKITELKDYKKSIIYEYVTGKKKV